MSVWPSGGLRNRIVSCARAAATCCPKASRRAANSAVGEVVRDFHHDAPASRLATDCVFDPCEPGRPQGGGQFGHQAVDERRPGIGNRGIDLHQRGPGGQADRTGKAPPRALTASAGSSSPVVVPASRSHSACMASRCASSGSMRRSSGVSAAAMAGSSVRRSGGAAATHAPGPGRTGVNNREGAWVVDRTLLRVMAGVFPVGRDGLTRLPTQPVCNTARRRPPDDDICRSGGAPRPTAWRTRRRESPIPLKGEGFEDASLRLQRPGAACVSHMGRTYHDSNRNASAATEETRRHVGAPRCALSSRPLKGAGLPARADNGFGCPGDSRAP